MSNAAGRRRRWLGRIGRRRRSRGSWRSCNALCGRSRNSSRHAGACGRGDRRNRRACHRSHSHRHGRNWGRRRGALLHDVRRLMGHQTAIILRFAVPQPDVVLVCKSAGIESRGGFVGRCILMDAHAAQVHPHAGLEFPPRWVEHGHAGAFSGNCLVRGRIQVRAVLFARVRMLVRSRIHERLTLDRSRSRRAVR